MIQTTEIATGIYCIAMWDEADLVKAKIFWPGATYNLFLIRAAQPVIIQTMFRRAFTRLRDHMRGVLDPAKLRYIVVPHHEGDSSGAINEWTQTAPNASILCSELCAALSLRDLATKEPQVVVDGEVLDLGTHRLRFLMTPQVNEWDSLMVYEETTGTLFPNDLFSSLGTEAVTDGDRSREALGAAPRARLPARRSQEPRASAREADTAEHQDHRADARPHAHGTHRGHASGIPRQRAGAGVSPRSRAKVEILADRSEQNAAFGSVAL